MKFANLLLPAAVLAFILSGKAWSGPPLNTDDPGILEPGSWEIITAVVAEQSASGSVLHAPLLDISLGVSPNSQLSLSVPRTVLEADGMATWSGVGEAALGYKWRFLARGEWEWAAAVNYISPVTRDMERFGLEGEEALSIPLLVSRSHGNWTLNSQLAWNRAANGEKSWTFGMAASRPLTRASVLMVELFGDTDSVFGNHSLNAQIGVDYALRGGLHLLAAAGTGLIDGPDRRERLRYCAFLGFQIFP